MSGKTDGPSEGLRSLLLLFLFTSLMSASGWLWYWDQVLYDLQLGMIPGNPAADIVIVAVDEQSQEQLGRRPWSPDLYARLVERLTRADARAIMLDLHLAATQGDEAEVDNRLIQAVAASGRVFLPVTAQWGMLEAQPLPALANVAAGLGHMRLAPDRDGIVRGFYLYEGPAEAPWPHIMLAMRHWLQPGLSDELPVALTSQRTATQQISRRDRQLIPFTGAAGSYPYYSFSRVLAGDYPAELFRDRIVLLGAAGGELGSGLPTPLSDRARPMPQVEILAHILDGLRREGGIRPLGFFFQLSLSGLLVALALALYAFVPVRWVLAVAAGVLSIFLLADWLLLFGLQRWFPPSPVILGLLLSYPLWSWQRQRQTLRRLDRQLTGMQQERSLRSLPRSRADLVAAMDFLGHLMPLQGWVLYKDERRLDGSGQVLGAPLVPLASGHWQRSGAELWILINRDEGSWRLGLLWPRTQVPNGRALQLLSDMAQRFNGADTGCGAGWPALVEHRMRELREADLYQRHQCRLVEDVLGELGEGLMVIDSLGRVIMSNPCAVSYLGGAQDEDFVGVEAGALLNRLEIQASLSWAEVWRRVFLGGEVLRIVARGASQADISVRLRPLDRAQAGGHGMVANFSLLRTYRESGQA